MGLSWNPDQGTAPPVTTRKRAGRMLRPKRTATGDQVDSFRETSFGTGPMNVHPRGHGGRHMGGNGLIVW